MALNAVVAALTLATLYALMRERVGDPRLARLGLAALLCDNAILVNYVEKSATDVFALLFIGAGGARRPARPFSDGRRGPGDRLRLQDFSDGAGVSDAACRRPLARRR